MSFRHEMREDFGVVVFITTVISSIVCVVLAHIVIIGFFIRGCVPTITAAGDKFAKNAVESMGEDFEEHSWKNGKKGDDDNERTGKNDENEAPKNVEQGSAGVEGAASLHLLRRRTATV